VALTAIAVTACAWWLWPRNVYRYQGKTVEQWFKDFAKGNNGGLDMRSWNAFSEMGTNAVPFLASRINQNFTPSLLERWKAKLPRFEPKSAQADRAAVEANDAALLLTACIKPPRGMLRQLLAPALQSTDYVQQKVAEFALR